MAYTVRGEFIPRIGWYRGAGKFNYVRKEYTRAYSHKRTIEEYEWLVENFVDLCKGRYTRDFERTFYRLFLDRVFNMPLDLVYKEVSIVIRDLKSIHWMDDDDMRQYIRTSLAYLFSKTEQQKEGIRGKPRSMRGRVAQRTRDYLVNTEKFWHYLATKKYIDSAYITNTNKYYPFEELEDNFEFNQ